MVITLFSFDDVSEFVVLDSSGGDAGSAPPPAVFCERALLLTELSLLPLFRDANSGKLVLRTDLDDSRDAIAYLAEAVPGDLFGSQPRSVMIGPTTHVDLAASQVTTDPVYYAGLRNVLRLIRGGVTHDVLETHLDYFGGAGIRTTSGAVVDEVRRQLARAAALEASHAGQFAHSAYYMGSKRALSTFIVEAIGSTLSDDGIVVDLMCGSGAASGAFCRLWRTIASDAQEFCRVLAAVQGGGYQRTDAAAILDSVLQLARQHAGTLQRPLADALTEEEAIFHGDLDRDTLRRYREFLGRWPTYPGGRSRSGWDPVREVQLRQRDPQILPYCLFTAYYANVYFGLRQAVEIDGLRYAIDQVEDAQDRIWALGALIASVSALGSTFGGHFAQPPIRQPSHLNMGNLGRLIEGRAASITHEFCARYLSLASESERTTYPVETVSGPWQVALDSVEEIVCSRQEVTVYVDAPYTREEYSRYYHLLETLVNYRYPDSVGIGRVPSKLGGGRFRSEFFTRSSDRLVDALCSVIVSVLRRGWTCAWSYSDGGGVSIPRVIEEVNRHLPCDVRSYAAPYRHKALGSRSAKAVTEYLLIARQVQT